MVVTADQPEHACAVGAQLGEGPVWVERDQALWFVDIKGRNLHRFDPRSRAHDRWSAPEQPGFLVPLRGRDFLVGLKNGLHRFVAHEGLFARLTEVEPQLPNNRLNDGAIGPDGALWFGSMDDDEVKRTGRLYRLAAQGRVPVALDDGYVITNGPAWSPDGRVFYHTDTLERVVYAFDVPSPGVLSGKRVFVRIEEGAGYPDGSAVDAEGCLWVAFYGGWMARRYAPTGEVLRTVRFPCANITKLAFGGVDGRTAFATTAWKGLSASERAAQPQAGDLFSFRVEAPGLKAREFVFDS